DALDFSHWTPSQTGLFLAYLPFTPATWERSTRLLGERESLYWSKTSANPYEAEGDLRFAINLLVEHGRPSAAIGCLSRILHEERSVDSHQAIRVLRAALHSPESVRGVSELAIRDLFKTLQNDPEVDTNDLIELEWGFLPLLDRHRGASPKTIERRLADDPTFFCDVIRTVFRSKLVERPAEELTPQQRIVAENAYRL